MLHELWQDVARGGGANQAEKMRRASRRLSRPASSMLSADNAMRSAPISGRGSLFGGLFPAAPAGARVIQEEDREDPMSA